MISKKFLRSAIVTLLAVSSIAIAHRVLGLKAGESQLSVQATQTYAFTQQAWPVTGTLHGMVLTGLPSLAWFEWGTNEEYGQTTSPVEINASDTVVGVSSTLSNLAGGRLYHFRLMVSNSNGIVTGANQFFLASNHPLVRKTPPKLLRWDSSCSGEEPGYVGDPGWPVEKNLLRITSPNERAIVAVSPHRILRNDGTIMDRNVSLGWEPFWAVVPGISNVVAFSSRHFLRIDGTLLDGTGKPVPGASNILALADELALTRDGMVRFYGSSPQPADEPPSGLSNIVQIASGGGQRLALRADGTVRAWGRNDHAQIQFAEGLSNIVSVAAGVGHCLALRTDGTVVAWGPANYDGVVVPAGLSNVVGIAAGLTSFALREDGSLFQWSCPGDSPPSSVKNVMAIVTSQSYGNAVLADNVPPRAHFWSYQTPQGKDLMISLPGSDLNEDLLQARILTLPKVGQLYQVHNGQRGAPIEAPASVVSDLLRRVIYSPPPNASGNPLTSFDFAVSDGDSESKASVAISLVEPFPKLTVLRNPFYPGGPVEFVFAAEPNKTYTVWRSIDLREWHPDNPRQGNSGLFRFSNHTAAKLFFRVTSP